MGKDKQFDIQELFDRELNENERKSLLNAVNKKPEGLSMLNNLSETDRKLYTLNRETATADFTDRVMAGLENQANANPVYNWNLILILTGVFITLIISFISLSNFNPEISIPSSITLLNQQVNTEGLKTAFSFITLKSVVHSVLFGAFTLAMILFDRAILRPFFEHKKYA